MQATHSPRRRTRPARAAVFVAALLVMLAVVGLRPAAPALAACGGTTLVSDTTSLNTAIIAFNTAPGPCVFGIKLTGSIILTANLNEIVNTNPGVELTIDGAGYRLDGDRRIYRGFDIDSVDRVTFQDITISEFYEFGVEGADGDLHVRRSTIQMNGSDGIYWERGDLLVVDSAIIYNTDDAIDHGGDGASITIINSTLAANGRTGISAANSDPVTGLVTHTTIVGNGRQGLDLGNGTVTINNSIFADNLENCTNHSSTTVVINNSLLDDTDDTCELVVGANGNIVGQDARLMPLGFYGGPTQTMPPVALDGGPASPAIDNGSEALSKDEGGATLLYDQRGTDYPRKSGEGVDMGAAETVGAFVCPTFPTTVTEADQLAVAILCYNEQTTPGVYKIIMAWNIDLKGSTPTIDNDTGGVSLVITGGGRMLNARDIAGARPISVAAGSTATLHSLKLADGNNPYGGGIFNEGVLTLKKVWVMANTAFHSGGGVANVGTMTLNDSVVGGNLVKGYGEHANGGGIVNVGVMRVERSTLNNNFVYKRDGKVYGGGIANRGDLIIRDSAITNNHTVVDPARSTSFAYGGGIYSGIDQNEVATVVQDIRLTIINSTISGNSISGDLDVLGAGIMARGVNGNCCTDSTVELINVTVVDNSLAAESVFGGSGLFFDASSADHPLDVTIHNSIVAGNLANGATGQDCLQSYTSWLTFESRHTLYQSSGVDGACGLAAANPDANGNIVGLPADLGQLAGYGGPTRNHLPNPSSPAINSGNNALAVDEEGQPLAADQRGFTPRDAGGTVDMGAVETDATDPSRVYMSAAANGTADSVSFDNSDILQWDGEVWGPFFDGSAAGLAPNNKPKHNVNAFYVDSGTNGVWGEGIAMSFAQNGRKVPGLTAKVDGTDLLWWDGSAFSLLFDGSDVGLTKKTAEKIDGLHMLDGSDSLIGGGCVVYLLISTQGPGAVPAYGGGQIKFGGEDVLGFCATNLGEATAGFWHMVLDGSAVGVKKNAIDSISLSEDGETLYLTSKGAFNVGGATGNHSMVYAYDMYSETFSGPHFIAADNGLTVKVDGLQVDGFCWVGCG